MEVAASNKSGASRIRPGENLVTFIIRIQQEQAAQDPAYAARLRSSQTEARADAARRNIDTGGDS